MRVLVTSLATATLLLALSPQDAAFAPIDAQAQGQTAPVKPINPPMPPAPAPTQKGGAVVKAVPAPAPAPAPTAPVPSKPVPVVVQPPKMESTSATTPASVPKKGEMKGGISTPKVVEGTGTPSHNLEVPETKSYFHKVTITPPENAKLLKTITLTYKGESGQDISQRVMVNKLIDPKNPIVVTHSPAPKIKILSYKVVPLFTLYVANHKIFIQTNDEEIRDFYLRNPDRLVMDFKTKSVPKFKTIVQKIKSDFITKMVIGYHGNGEYRVVLYLNKPYKYRITRFNDGLKVDFAE
jgi:hypothetical protein